MSERLAPSLKRGDKIGFFSPSSAATAFAPKRFKRATEFIQDKGFTLISGNLTGKQDFYRSGSIKARAEELNLLIQNPEIRCIIATIGGYNSNALLPYLDYETLIRDPKIIMGYSDVTALLLGIYAKTGLITFYGPALVASFGEFPPLVDQTYAPFHDILCQNNKPTHTYKMPAQWTDTMLDWETQTHAKSLNTNVWQFLGKGKHEGRLIGGNLNTLAGIWGSPYMPEILEGDILLLEDALLTCGPVERSFNLLKLNGIFDKVSAIILGKHELFNDQGSRRQPLDILLEVLDDKAVPILNGFDSCHTHPMLITPIGSNIEIDFDQEIIRLTSPWTT